MILMLTKYDAQVASTFRGGRGLKRSFDSVSGTTVEYRISAEGMDSEIVEIEE